MSLSPVGEAVPRPGPGPWPERIDRYQIVRQIGEGGMGVVFLARQEEPVRREVALKVLRAGGDSADVVARFAVERQALASMEHPGITHVFDAGLTVAGQPYFVMELVDGVPLDEFASRERLATRDRVRLFVQVCRAVQHAHQKGIIHRDLKPSNVMVVEGDGGPLCKVIDFGIAKATGELARAARITATGMSLGTPAYMSPEQLLDSPSDVDTRSDIYSLGVVLYELLTGVLPGDSSGSVSWASLMRRAEGDFPSASAQFAALDAATRDAYAAERATDPATLGRLLHGDLDCILLKALDPDRERRYSSAAAFAHDLEQYLADRPVEARSPSAAYRMAKFARRHQAGVILAGLLLVVLVVTAVGATVQARRLAVARSVAVSRQEQAEKLIAFMLGDLNTKLRPIGRLDVLDDVASGALQYFASVADGTMSVREQYRRADAFRQLAGLRVEQGRFIEAEAHYARAVQQMRLLAASDSTHPEWQLGLAHAEFGAGSLAWRQGRMDDALRHLEPFVRISERLVAQYPESLGYRAERAYALINIGAAMEGRGETARALESYEAAREILDPLARGAAASDDWRVALGAVLNSKGVAQRKLGDLDGALTSHLAEIAQRRDMLARDTTDAERRRFVGIAHLYLGELHLWRGAVDEALVAFGTAHGIYARLVASDPSSATKRLNLAGSERRLGQALLERGDLPGAAVRLAEARATIAPLLGGGINERALREAVVIDALTARRLVTARLGSEASAIARRATTIGDSALVRHPADLDWRRQVGRAHLVLGDAFRMSGDSAEAFVAWSRALSLAEASPAVARETDMLALSAEALKRLGRTTEAQAAASELRRRGVALPSLMRSLREPRRDTR